MFLRDGHEMVCKVINIDGWLEFTGFDKTIFLSESLVHKLQ